MGLLNQDTITAPVATGFYEYLLVAQPDPEAYAKLMAEKQFFFEKFQTPVAIKTKPHITVAGFLAFEAMEETMIRWMARVISAKQRFSVTLDGYGAFRPHTLYLHVKDHEPFLQLAKELKVVDQYIQGYGCPEMQLVSNPHLTIARRLDAVTYAHAVETYADKTFETSFHVKELVLLRRRGRFDTCRQVNVFGLRP
ncbi:2'-5' RNA ligase family protein [Sediminibacterium soli]|uniref:2'-5' RNA ligase family protein n=1 Tax=Sediminibacterium soli TaxID=2698829 RepID=UPI001379DC46|nr:2'-5' RNA ligase family protein [Sediminibacterium soli]NCI45381.1 2'-5' RNA ligase family protein [Sediminibacterium soli]